MWTAMDWAGFVRLFLRACDFTQNPGSERYRLWLLKKSLRGSGRKKDHARMPYNRRSWLG